MELAFRIIVSVVLTGVWLIGLRWVWTNQLDPRATVARLSEKTLAPPDWVATRDPSKVYQDGNAVGDITGAVKPGADQIHFAQLANTASLDVSRPFEYQRLRVKVIKIDSSMGMKVVTSGSGSTVLRAVLEGVQCTIVK
ncbi:MAG: hypothetical protein AB1806_10660 [Acidobacteriota bacterium]